MEGILISFLSAAIFGILFYTVRLQLTRKPDQMRRFLDRRFDVIRRKGYWGEQRDYIDAAMIKRWGHSGWFLILLPALNLSLSVEQLWSIRGLSSISLLVFAGMFFGDSRAGVRFLKDLGIDRYSKEAEQGAA